MARKSGGTIPPAQMITDANQAIALLTTMHHWAASKENREGERVRYSISITHAGRRVSASAVSFVGAVDAAFKKLRGEKDPPPSFMRLVQ